MGVHRSRTWKNLRSLAFALLATAASAVAQFPEEAALAAKGQADYQTMRTEFARLLAGYTAPATPDAKAAADAEYCATMLLRMMSEGRDATSMAAVEAARNAPRSLAMPALRARLGSLLLQARRYYGGDAEALVDELGVIRSLWICGAFDNERGSGYRTSYEPEKGFDPEATYQGKLHQVSWRRLPVQPSMGYFDLGSVLRPQRQVMAYVATALVADERTDAALWFGSPGAVRVFLNGAEVFARDVQREVHDDQDAVVLPLRKGHNLLVLKACRQEQSAGVLTLRVAACDGSPLSSVRTSDLEQDLVQASRQKARPADASSSVADNARSYYLQRAAAGDAEAALKLTAILTHNHVDGDRDARAQRLAEQAAKALPKSAEAAFLRFWTRPRLRTSAADRDENPQRRDLLEVLRRAPEHVEARLLLASLDMGSGVMSAAERILRDALAQQPQSSIAHANLAVVLRRLGLDAAGDRLLAAMLDLPHVALGSMRYQFRTLRERGEYGLAERVGTRLMEQSVRGGDQVMFADLLFGMGKDDEGLALLKAARARWPMMRLPRAKLARLHAAHGRLDDALQEWLQWLEICPDDDQALLSVAGLHARKGDQERQVEVLRAAILLNPNLTDEQRYLDYLSSAQTPFYQDFEVDGAEVLAADEGPPADAAENQDPVYHVLNQRVVKAFANGTTSEYLHTITKVLREEGGRRFANWRVPYYRGSQRARVLSCTVTHEDGSVNRPRLRGASIRTAALQPGDTIEIRSRIDDLAPTFFGEYFGFEHHFASPDGSPVGRSQLTVIATKGRDYLSQAVNGAPEPEVTELDDGSKRYDWSMQGLGRDEPEVSRPAAKERVPLVRMTTYRDWDHFSGWWWNLIEKQIDVSEPMRQKVRELTAKCTTPAERLDAIYGFVTNDVRYEAWEFGVHGYKPYNTSVIFERRHGDCKDKALLLCAMLREVAIVARPVLIFADPRRSEDDLSLPLVHHFNHCIAWLPEQDGLKARFLDGTADLHPSDTLPEMDVGARVLVVEPDGAALRDVPWTTPENNGDSVAFAIELAADGSAKVAMTETPNGATAVGTRQDLVGSPDAMKEQLERRLLARFGPCRIQGVESSKGDDLATPVRRVVTFEADEIARRRGKDLVLRTGFDSTWLQQLSASPERLATLLLGAPRRQHDVLRVLPPDKMAASTLPPPTDIRHAFGSYRLEWRREGDRLVVERDLRIATARVTREQYAQFREFVAAVQDADDALLVLQPKEGK